MRHPRDKSNFTYERLEAIARGRRRKLLWITWMDLEIDRGMSPPTRTEATVISPRKVVARGTSQFSSGGTATSTTSVSYISIVDPMQIRETSISTWPSVDPGRSEIQYSQTVSNNHFVRSLHRRISHQKCGNYRRNWRCFWCSVLSAHHLSRMPRKS